MASAIVILKDPEIKWSLQAIPDEHAKTHVFLDYAVKMTVITALEILDELKDQENRKFDHVDFMKDLEPSLIKGLVSNLIEKQFKNTKILKNNFDKLAREVEWEKEELATFVFLHPAVIKNDTEEANIIWREMRHMVIFYIESFLDDPIGSATKNTFMLNSRVVAKKMSTTEMFVMNKDLEKTHSLPPIFRQNLVEANKKWIELNLTRTVGFRAELTIEKVKEQYKKIDELQKLFDGFLAAPKETKELEINIIGIHNALIPTNAKRMKMTLEKCRNEILGNLAYSRSRNELKVDGVMLKSGILKQIHLEIESKIKTKALETLSSDLWKPTEIIKIRNIMSRTVDMDPKNLMVLYNLVQPRGFKHKIRLSNPYGYIKCCGHTERTDGVKLNQCKTLIQTDREMCQIHETIKKAIKIENSQKGEFPIIFGQGKVIYTKPAPRPNFKENPPIMENVTKLEVTENFLVNWSNQKALLKRAHARLESYWQKLTPRNVTENDVSEYNEKFPEVEGNLYCEMINLMSRIQMDNTNRSCDINDLLDWEKIEKFLDEIMSFNEAQGQLLGRENQENWPRGLKTRKGPDGNELLNRNSDLLRQTNPVGNGRYSPLTSAATNHVQGFVGEIGHQQKGKFSLTLIMDHFTLGPRERIKNGNSDSFSHNDGIIHNQCIAKLLYIQELGPNGKSEQIDLDYWQSTLNGRTFFENNNIPEEKRTKFLQDTISFIALRISRYDTEVNLQMAINGDPKKDKNSLIQGKVLAKEMSVLAKLTDELAKCGTNLVIYFSGKVQLGQFLRSFDLLRKEVPNFMNDWSLERLMTEPLTFAVLNHIHPNDKEQVGVRFTSPVVIISPIRNTGNPNGRECDFLQITVLKNEITEGKHIWESLVHKNRLNGISTIWNRLAVIGNMKVSYLQIKDRKISVQGDWIFDNGFRAQNLGAIVNHRRRFYTAHSLFHNENEESFDEMIRIKVPGDINGGGLELAEIVTKRPISHELLIGYNDKSEKKIALKNMSEFVAKLLFQMENSNMTEICGTLPFWSLGFNICMKNTVHKNYKRTPYDDNICFKMANGAVHKNIPSNVATKIAHTRYENNQMDINISRRTDMDEAHINSIRGIESVKVNRDVLTKGLDTPTWTSHNEAKMNPSCSNTQNAIISRINKNKGN